MNQESIQQKIQVARRDAEALKDRIKRKKDELADTTRTSPQPALLRAALHCTPQTARRTLLAARCRLHLHC